MTVIFTNCCPNCDRKRRMQIELLGTTVRCVQCGKTSLATDAHNESLAMQDSMKDHAELSQPQPGEIEKAKIRAPR